MFMCFLLEGSAILIVMMIRSQTRICTIDRKRRRRNWGKNVLLADQCIADC